MDRLQFVDATLHHVCENDPESSRYAIDLGICSSFAKRGLPGENLHHFVSAVPWIKGVNRRQARVYLMKFSHLNPDVTFGLLELEQIEELNVAGDKVGFRIDNTWTSSTSNDLHGRVDGYYSLIDGKEVIDWGENRNSVYVVFGFVPGQEHEIIMP